MTLNLDLSIMRTDIKGRGESDFAQLSTADSLRDVSEKSNKECFKAHHRGDGFGLYGVPSKCGC